MPRRKRKVEEAPVLGEDRPDPSGECVIHVIGGKELRSPAFPGECDYVRVVDDDGEELGYWHADEFAEDPQDTLGALMGCLKKGLEEGDGD